MRSLCSQEEDEEDQFFDSREDIVSTSDSGSDCPENADLVSSVLQYDVWNRQPGSVQERRDRFLKLLGVGPDGRGREGELSVEVDSQDRVREDFGTILANSDSDNVLSYSRSTGSCSSSGTRDHSEGRDSDASFMYTIKNLDDGTEFMVDQLGEDGIVTRLREVGSNRLLTVEEFHYNLRLTPLIQYNRRKSLDKSISAGGTKRLKSGWLRKLGVAACVMDRQHGTDGVEPVSTVPKTQRVKVHSTKKRSKELSALYVGQEIQAHEGSILSMKFSPDGYYLASAGEDRVVRVWKVMKSERSNGTGIPDFEQSGLYFVPKSHSELPPLSSTKGKLHKIKSQRKSSDSVCTIFPPRVFRLSDDPIHEFRGHSGEILDLSWSKNKCLLSSSVDKTVRLWQVGCAQCLRVFSHNNYVTCIQFNPTDDNYFISGSIDGKVRIWNVPDCRVVDWTDIKDIVTAVCYRPDGKGGIVGSMTGNCRFYDIKDNHLQLDARIYLQGKKKSPGKRITGFQFSPNDPAKLMVTSADSQVRILNGVDVIYKYKGLRNAGSQIAASFTVDGKHIVSASEDSNVYVWNYEGHEVSSPKHEKTILSRESFFSGNVSVAIPWCGLREENSVISNSWKQIPETSPTSVGNRWQRYRINDSHTSMPLSPQGRSSPCQRFFQETSPKGTATWPEEKLPTPKSVALSPVGCKTQYKLLKSFYQNTTPHAWGMVIVAGGWDGRIRSFHNYGLPVHT